MSSMVSLHFRYTEEEFIAATRLYLLRTPRTLARLGLFSGMFTLGFYWLFSLTAGMPAAFLLILPIIMFALCYSTFYAMPRKAYARDPRNKEEFFWQFSEAGITQKTSLSEASIRWELFTKVLANRQFYVLGYGKNMFTMIPRRAFATPAQEAAFVALLRRKITPDFNTNFLPAAAAGALDNYKPPTTPPDWR